MKDIYRLAIPLSILLYLIVADSNAQSPAKKVVPAGIQGLDLIRGVKPGAMRYQSKRQIVQGIGVQDGKGVLTGPTEPILDSTFGINGTIRVAINGADTSDAAAQSLAIQKDGKLVVAGYSARGLTNIFVLARYEVGGALDTTFGLNGIVKTQFPDGVGHDIPYSTAIQADGKIVVAGASSNNGSGSTFAVARYDTDGSLDGTFGTNGTVKTEINGYGNNDGGYSVAIQSNGKIVVAGNSNGSIAVVRYNPDGTVDNGFGKNGRVMAAIKGGDGTEDDCRSVAIQLDGKIVVGGSSYSFFGGGFAFAIARFDTDGTLDSTFGGSGTIMAPLGHYGPNATGQSVVIQSDGRIVIAGSFNNDDGMGNEFAAYRYRTDGTLDSTFGKNGFVRNKINGGTANDDRGLSVKLQSDGRIVIAGTSSDGTGYSFAATRYDTNGTVDSTFGTNGCVIRSIDGGNGTDDEASAVSIQGDGKIVLCGYSAGRSDSAFALARFDSVGTTDSSFGGDGTVRTIIENDFGNDLASSIAIQSDGKIIVAGTSYDGSNSAMAVARFNANGSLDNSFGRNGAVNISIVGGIGKDRANSVAVQSDGKIVVAGSSYNGSATAIAIARCNIDGTLDNTFGANGTLRPSVIGGDGTEDIANSVAVQNDGKIVVGGSSHGNTGYAIAVVRFNATGSLDNTFGTSGCARTSVPGGDGSDDGLMAVAVQPDGKIVGTGFSASGSSFAIPVVRLNSNGTPDYSFGTNGSVRMSILGGDGASDYGESIALQSDGKIVVAGLSQKSSGSAFALARCNTNGTLDNTFGSNGTVRTSVIGSDGTSDVGESVVIQPDGRIVVAGLSDSNSTYAFAVVRYTPRGVPDSTFNTTGMVRTSIGGGYYTQDIGRAVSIQPNGKIVVCGISLFIPYNDFALARFLPGTRAYASSLLATGVDSSNASVNGIVFPFKSSAAVRFVYGNESKIYTDSVIASPAGVYGDTTTRVSATLSHLAPHETLYYRVSGTMSATGNYFVSDEKSFTTLDPVPLPPALISPCSSTGVPRKATLVWHSSAFAMKYHFQLSQDSTFASVVYDTTLADTALKLSNPLSATTKYFWQVCGRDSSGSGYFSLLGSFVTGTGLDAVGEEEGIPKSYALYQNYPNPFNPSTIVRFDLKQNSKVTLEVYNALGEKVEYWSFGVIDAGRYDKVLNMHRFASGIYFYRIDAEGNNGEQFVSIKKMVLMK